MIAELTRLLRLLRLMTLAQAAAQALVQQLQELSGESLQVATVPSTCTALRVASLLVFKEGTPL